MAVAHVVGGLTVDQGRMFRSHLLECTACRARVGELRAIAHDLADVERDERRLRTAKRIETKSHDGDDGDQPPPSTPRLGGRTTLLMAAGLTILMALSAWNFVLRGRLQAAEQMVTMLRQSVGVLQDGQPWQTMPSSSGVDGQVSTIDQSMVIMVDGLVEDQYGIYLLRSDGQQLTSWRVEATDGMLYDYLADSPFVADADSVVVVRATTSDLEPLQDENRVFEAHREPVSPEIGIQPVAEPSG